MILSILMDRPGIQVFKQTGLGNSIDPDENASEGAVSTLSTLFATLCASFGHMYGKTILFKF